MGRVVRAGVAGGAHPGEDDVLALRGEDRLAVQLLERVGEATAIPGLAAGVLQLEGVAAAARGSAAAQAQVVALPAFLGHDVDHAGHRVGTVDRRGAGVEHFDACDRRGGDAADAHTGAGRARAGGVLGHALAVDQDQLVADAHAAQVEERCVGLGDAETQVVVGCRAGDSGAVELGQRPERFGNRAEALLADVLGGDHHHRRRAFHLGALDARTGDFDLVQSLGGDIGGRGGIGGLLRVPGLRGGGAGEGRRRQGQAHQDRCEQAGTRRLGVTNGHGWPLSGRNGVDRLYRC